MRAVILAAAFRVPEKVRTNQDPIFDWLHAHPQPGQDLFAGYDQRRVLDDGQTVVDLMAAAAASALSSAGVAAADVGALAGYASVGDYVTPSDLSAVHHALGLPASCWLLPISDDFTNFLSGLLVAQALVETRRARHVLVVCGSNWSRYSNYHTPQSISSADGAGAVVVGASEDRSRFAIVDAVTAVDPSHFGAMFMRGEPITLPPGEAIFGFPAIYSHPWFTITADGQQQFKTWGIQAPPRLVLDLLARHSLEPREVTLFTHQASSVLLDAWARAIEPGQYPNSLAEFANMTVATLAVNFAKFHDAIENDHVVLSGVGPCFQTTAVLLRRNG